MATSHEDLQPISNPVTELATDVERSLSWQVANNLFVSFKYAWQGVTYAFRTQRNFRIHVSVGTLAVSLALWLRLSPVEIAIISLTCGAVLTMELINTALESIVDLTVQQTYHELAKIAKDCAAAAVLISALIAVFVAACLLLPPLWILLQA
ncbi:MAG TPA: diacylglycerol kinase family protein [Trichocoleus sp.]